jgi:hypothetical protein
MDWRGTIKTSAEEAGRRLGLPDTTAALLRYVDGAPSRMGRRQAHRSGIETPARPPKAPPVCPGLISDGPVVWDAMSTNARVRERQEQDGSKCGYESETDRISETSEITPAL